MIIRVSHSCTTSSFNSLLLLVPFLILDAKRVISVDSCTISHSSSPCIISPFQLQEFYCQQNHVWSPTPSHRSHILPHASSRSPRVVNKGIPLFCTHLKFLLQTLIIDHSFLQGSFLPRVNISDVKNHGHNTGTARHCKMQCLISFMSI